MGTIDIDHTPSRLPEPMDHFGPTFAAIESDLRDGKLRIGPLYVVEAGKRQGRSVKVQVVYKDAPIRIRAGQGDNTIMKQQRHYVLVAYDGVKVLGYKKFFLHYNYGLWGSYAIADSYAAAAYRQEGVGSALELSMSHLLVLWRNEHGVTKINRTNEVSHLQEHQGTAAKLALYGKTADIGRVDYDIHNVISSGIEAPFAQIEQIDLTRNPQFPAKLRPVIVHYDLAAEADSAEIQNRRIGDFTEKLLPLLRQAQEQQVQ